VCRAGYREIASFRRVVQKGDHLLDPFRGDGFRRILMGLDAIPDLGDDEIARMLGALEELGMDKSLTVSDLVDDGLQEPKQLMCLSVGGMELVDACDVHVKSPSKVEPAASRSKVLSSAVWLPALFFETISTVAPGLSSLEAYFSDRP